LAEIFPPLPKIQIKAPTYNLKSTMSLVEIEIGWRGLGVILIVFRVNLRFRPDVLFDIVGQGAVVDPEVWGANSGGTVLVVFY
jgi:hypothetical protein